MTSIWTYPSGVATADRDVVGYDVEATDGRIGKIDEASNEVGRRHMVVDTGFWIFGKKRLIPAGVVNASMSTTKRSTSSMTKDQIKSAPDYDDQRATITTSTTATTNHSAGERIGPTPSGRTDRGRGGRRSRRGPRGTVTRHGRRVLRRRGAADDVDVRAGRHGSRSCARHGRSVPSGATSLRLAARRGRCGIVGLADGGTQHPISDPPPAASPRA